MINQYFSLSHDSNVKYYASSPNWKNWVYLKCTLNCLSVFRVLESHKLCMKNVADVKIMSANCDFDIKTADSQLYDIEY